MTKYIKIDNYIENHVQKGVDSKLLIKRIACIVLISIFFIPLMALAAEDNWPEVVSEIESMLYTGRDAYAEGRPGDAKALISDAYFNAFEGKGMETAIGIYISSKRVYELESMFGDIRKAISAKESVQVVNGKIDLLVKALTEDVKKLPEKGGGREGKKEPPYAIFFNAFIIILREGFEAIIVISALTAYLVKTGHKEKVRTVYNGAVAALIASIFTALILQTVIKISGAGKEAIEGITMIFATAVLFYVSYWLISKIEVARWHHYIRSKVESSLSRGNIIALGFASFLAVYREGAETILFYQALHSSSGGSGGEIILGFFAGLVPLIGLFILIKYGSVRIPISPFFAVTSALLYYLAFTFAGKGVRELQEAGWISSTGIKGFPTIDFVGIYPTWEGILFQAILVMALIGAIVYNFANPLPGHPLRPKANATGRGRG